MSSTSTLEAQTEEPFQRPSIHNLYDDQTIRSFYENGYWQKRNLYDYLVKWAKQTPAKLCIADESKELTYSQVLDQVRRLALGLRRMGVKVGDRVAVQLPNRNELPIVVLALARLGAVIVPTMMINRDEEVKHVLAHASCSMYIGTEFYRKFNFLDMAKRLQNSLPGVPCIMVGEHSDLPDFAVAFDDVLVDDLPDVDSFEAEIGPGAHPDDGFLMVYTSGTTAAPKGCWHSFNTTYASCRQMLNVLGERDDDTYYVPSPAAHSTGMVTGVVMPIVSGSSAIYTDRFVPERSLEVVDHYKCTLTWAATPFVAMTLPVFDPAKHSGTSMRAVILAGAPIPPKVVQDLMDIVPECRVISLYGRTESFAETMCRLEDPPEKSMTSDGKALPGSKVSIRDPETGEELPVGQQGDITYWGPSQSLAYFRDPDGTKNSYSADGFQFSGDLGVMDSDGYIRVNGRVKDVIIRGGINISPAEIEDRLHEMPQIQSVAVVGMPDQKLGEKSCAYVVLKPGVERLELKDVTDYLRAQKNAVQKLPERLEIVDELPLTPSGKIKKAELRADIAAKIAAEEAGV